MSGKILSDVFTYFGCALELCLFVYILTRGHARQLWDVALYLGASLGVNAARACVLYRYGFSSREYSYCYWTTDFLLVFAAFIIVGSFFRRASSRHPEMWRHLRLLLTTVFVLVAAVSFFSLSNPKEQVYTLFIVEFSQNLYFASLVLTTLLYLMIVKIEVPDDRLGLLVCGLGIEFAGPAAGLALTYLTRGADIAHVVGVYLFPLCDIGMILTWFYAVSRVPETPKVRKSKIRPRHILAEESVSSF